jgi:hypothetical protein
MHYALLSFSLFSLSPMVLAQNYSGSVQELNTIFEPPMNINTTICSVYTDEVSKSICSDGVSASRWMAEKYAAGAGKYLGCLDGFYQGVWDGYNASVNPSADNTKEAEAYVKGASFKSAGDRGLSKAQAEGQTESADQIIKRYRAVVGLNQLPNKEYALPKITFDGFDDGYENDVLGTRSAEFAQVEKLGWVTSSSPFADRIAARKSLEFQNAKANTCDMSQTIFGRRNMPAVTIWDYFRARRQANFESYGWRNPDWAWEVFDRDEKTLEQYQTFARIANMDKTVSRAVNEYATRLKLDAAGNPVKKVDAAGAPVIGSDGRPVYEMEQYITGSHLETTKEKLSPAEISALQASYMKGFKESYDRYYAKQYVSKSYNSEGMSSYNNAVIVGRGIGKEVAGETARKEAYNKLYKAQSASKYAEEVKRIYTTSFDKLINIFQNNPVIELNEVVIVGNDKDGIFRPGEQLKTQFTVTNLGEVAKQSSISMDNTNDVLATPNGFPFVAPVLKQVTLESGVLGVVSNKLEARATVNLGLFIKNPGDLNEVAKSLVVRKDKGIMLNDYVEIDSVKPELDYINGSLSVQVMLVNPSPDTMSPIADVELIVNGQATSKSIEPLNGKGSRPVLIQSQSLDPLALIINGGISGTVNSKIAGKIVHRSSYSTTVGVESNVALIQYFDALATKKTSNSANESKADRLAKLSGMFEITLRDQIKDINVRWSKETAKTIIYQIQNVYNEAFRAGRIDKDAQTAYDNLGRDLSRQQDIIRAGGFLLSAKTNKKDFIKELQKFAKGLKD